MSDPHCSACGEEATYDARGSGCGDTRCCFAVYDRECACDLAEVCTCDEADQHKSLANSPDDSERNER